MCQIAHWPYIVRLNKTMRDFFDPTPEEQKVVLVDATTLAKAEELIAGCEGCSPDDAEVPFDNILDQVTGNDPAVTDYILREPAKCPGCKRAVLEKTWLNWRRKDHRRSQATNSGQSAP